MPFDVVGDRPLVHLRDYLSRIGVDPIPMGYLLDYKQEQMRRHPAHFAVRGKTYGVIIGFGAVALSAFDVMQGSFGPLTWIADAIYSAMFTMAIFMLFAGITGAAGIKFRRRAAWREWAIWPAYLDKVPEPIRDIAEQVQAICPDSTLICGELIQEEKVIDPYLIVDLGGARACLGIWEDDKIVAVAKKID